MKYFNNADSLGEFFEFLWFDFKGLFPHWVARPITTYRRYRKVKLHSPGTLIETCSYHPAIIVSIDSDGHIWHYDLIKGEFGSCSLFHCGIIKIDMKKAIAMRDTYKTGGWKALESFLNLPAED